MNLLMKAYTVLFDHYGPQFWWPADTPLEMMVSAILVQNTNWKNVELALINLKPYVNDQSINTIPLETLEALIRPVGFYKSKSQTIQALLTYLKTVDCAKDTGNLRKELLAIKGIGPETADCILLYAFKRPVFVVDTYLKRFLNTLGLPAFKSYQGYQNYMHTQIKEDVALYSEFHALIVAYGKDKQDPLYDLHHPVFPYTQAELHQLSCSHPLMKQLIDQVGPLHRPVSSTPLHALIDAIIGQLISVKAAQAIATRFTAAFSDPYQLDTIPVETIKAVGLTQAKAETLQRIIMLINSKQLNLEQLALQSDEMIIQTLIQIKGVGVWTAQMVLIHGYHRRNVASFGDAALRNGLKALFELETLNETEFNHYMELFDSQKTLASIYLWKRSTL